MFNEDYQERLLRQLNIKLAPTSSLEARPFQAALPVSAGSSGSNCVLDREIAMPTKEVSKTLL
jgi:hypothetical protein